MKRQWSMIGAIILFLLVAILSVLNVESVPLNLGFGVVEWPLIIIIFVSVLLGAVIATLLSTFKVYRDKRERKKEQQILSPTEESAFNEKVEDDSTN